MNTWTYPEAALLASQLVALCELNMSTMRYDQIMDACLMAGRLRGLMLAGEPENSHLFDSSCYSAAALFNSLNRQYVLEVDGVPI